MTTRTGPTVRRRRLGAELRRIRETQHVTAEDAAIRLGWYKAKVSKIETGTITIPWSDVVELLDLYGCDDAGKREALIQLAKQAKQKGWWQPFNDLLSRDYATLIDLESAASSLRIYYPLTVPGLLQTADYARTIIGRSGPLELDEDSVERRVQLRLQRQAVIAEEPGLEMWVVLDEAALHRLIGGPVVMRAQLRRLAQAARIPGVTVQVIPYEAGPHASMASSVGIVAFPEPDEDIVYIETIVGILFLEREAEIRAATLGFDYLRAAALSAADSLDLIVSVAKSYG